MDKDFFNGKKVLVMGLGRFGGGVDAVKFAHKAGANVTVTDLAKPEELTESLKRLESLSDVEYHLGNHNLADFENADIIIVNPAVPPENQYLRFAAEHGKIITSQINIFFELCPAKIVGITGANGKSTTTALTAQLLRSAIGRQGFDYSNVILSGNIGNEPLLMTLDEIKPTDLIVLELSSFQIEHLAQIEKAPAVALITNLTANHLDRHGTFDAYRQAKENIFKFQKLDPEKPAVSIFNAEDKTCVHMFETYEHDPGRTCLKFSADDVPDDIREKFTLPGRANLSNLAAAMTITDHFGIERKRIKEALPGFKTLPHRLEFVAEIEGVRWYNDSIATTPQSTIVAIEAFREPKIIIAGGYDKNIAFDELGEKIAADVKAVVLIGQTADKIMSIITKVARAKAVVEIAFSLRQAVEIAARLANAGDVVLLSPACASYDMFENFEQRGRIFRDIVTELAQETL